ncbi:ribosome small subunit-dependent GTPase A [Eisenibacter elegans]|jgi:ribosome biogenesis GTPase|uniref:ribosome small subunit-dependent GTPase A n=1 Tax=Eisenibacter elegans TaxID=997 RepID=UPI000479AEC7|nr:ribosome small subunit-dependent GTPase A [Eisenibacter elegans]
MRSTGSWYDLRISDGSLLKARLRGKFKIKDLKVTNPLAVGDRVAYEMEAGQATALITEILPRDNYIIRKSVHKSAHGHLIATNIDQVLLIVTLVLPRTSLGFIDRYLAAAESFRIPARLIFNKCDLLDDEGREVFEELKAIYEPLGYPCHWVSATEGFGMDGLEAVLQGHTSLLSGHSGVGKSTLLNRLAPQLDLRVGEISAYSEKGTHTTTFAEMFEIAPDMFIIDTPGIKELGLIDMEKEELAHYFPEMRERLGECRFHNCLHLHEPQCAIRAAAEAGLIAESRYYNYLSMLADDDTHR